MPEYESEYSSENEQARDCFYTKCFLECQSQVEYYSNITVTL